MTNVLFWVFITVVFIVLTSDIIALLLLIVSFKKKPISLKSFPFVSILVAARNEEKNISRCIESLISLNYPSDRLEILVGDDDSEDDTRSMLSMYSKSVRIIPIIQNKIGMTGKANVLAQLASVSKGEFLFFTDADVQVSPEWIHSLLAAFKDGIGIVCGLTIVKVSSWFSSMQCLDWIHTIARLKIASDYERPLTAFGNNMAISKVAYERVGGYESLPFSVTEDYQLFKEVNRLGLRTRYVYSHESRNTTLAQKSYFSLMKQRKRWMSGIRKLPFPIFVILLSEALSIVAFIYVSFFTIWVIALFFLRLSVKSLFLIISMKRIQIKLNYLHIVIFEMYSGVLYFSSLIYFLLPTKESWKGRSYQ